MKRILYDLAGANPDLRFSPFCWRARLALAHKGLEFESIPWRFSEKEAIAFSGQDRVPVLIDGATVVSDSWAIALYLEKTYPERPSLFGHRDAVAPTKFLNHWVDLVLHPEIIRMIVTDIYKRIDGNDKEYFRKSREARFAMPLESITDDRATRIESFRALLQPLRATLSAQPFLGGDQPRYADYIAFGAFQFARCASDFELLREDDMLSAWRDRMFDLFNGLARRATRTPLAAATRTA